MLTQYNTEERVEFHTLSVTDGIKCTTAGFLDGSRRRVMDAETLLFSNYQFAENYLTIVFLCLSVNRVNLLFTNTKYIRRHNYCIDSLILYIRNVTVIIIDV